MKPSSSKKAAALAAAAGLLSPAVPAAPASYTLDPQHSFVQFEVLHFGTATLRGRFGPVPGEVQIDRAERKGSVALRIDVRTLDTGVKALDARLRQADLLAVESHPEAYFVATQFRFDGERLAEVRGEFTLRGVSQPLSLYARRFACRIDEQAVEVCGGDFEATLLRSDFGATFGLPFVSDRVRLQVQVEGRRR